MMFDLRALEPRHFQTMLFICFETQTIPVEVACEMHFKQCEALSFQKFLGKYAPDLPKGA